MPTHSRFPIARIVALAVLTGALVTSNASAQGVRSATVTVLHGLPNFTADVYVNGDLLLNGFEPETATDPLELPPGTYDLAIRNVGAAATSKPALSGSVTLTEGENLSIIAGVDLQGNPKLNVFANDLSPVPPGKARVVLRNVAEVERVDLRLGDQMAVRGVGNGTEGAASVDAGPRQVEVLEPGGDQTIVPSTSADLKEGSSVIVYLVGSRDLGGLDLMVQTIADVHSDPGAVDSGDGGLAATSGAWPGWAVALLIGCLVGVVVSARSLRRRAVR